MEFKKNEPIGIEPIGKFKDIYRSIIESEYKGTPEKRLTDI